MFTRQGIRTTRFQEYLLRVHTYYMHTYIYIFRRIHTHVIRKIEHERTRQKCRFSVDRNRFFSLRLQSLRFLLPSSLPFLGRVRVSLKKEGNRSSSFPISIHRRLVSFNDRQKSLFTKRENSPSPYVINITTTLITNTTTPATSPEEKKR